MMRLFLTILAALGFVLAALNGVRAEESDGPAVVTAAAASTEAAPAPAAPAEAPATPAQATPAPVTSAEPVATEVAPEKSTTPEPTPETVASTPAPAPPSDAPARPAMPAEAAPARADAEAAVASTDATAVKAKEEDKPSEQQAQAAAPAAAAIASDSSQAAPEAVPAAPRRFGLNHRDARVVLEAREESWVRISDPEGTLVFMRTLKPGETYNVPNRSGLVLESGNAKGLAVRVDGEPAPPFVGMVRRGIALDPEALASGNVARARTPEAALVAETATPATAMPVALTAPATAAAAPKPLSTEAPAREAQIATAAPAVATAVKSETAVTSAPAREAVEPAALPSPAIVAPKAKPEIKQPTIALATPRAAAQPAIPQPVTGAAAVSPAGVIAASNSRIAIEVNKGTLVRLRQPAATVFVADPEIADIQMKSAGLVYILGKRPGETALFAVDENERVLLNTTLVVDHNISRLRAALQAVAPDAPIDVVSVDGSLILTGTVFSAADAENIRRVAARFAPQPGAIINQLKVVAPNQINLRVRIAEVSRETLKSFGISWNSVAKVGSFAFGVATGAFLNNTPLNNVFAALYTSNTVDLNTLIDALGTEGLVTLLAEPNLTAMSGETASFLAGGEFPIPIAYPQNNSISIEFKSFGVGLAFTPTLLDGNRINLRVRPEVSQLSAAGAVQLSGFSIPALSTRRAETTVELASGQSFAIAGLLQNNSNQDISKVPFLGDLPVLGALFRSDRFRRNESELVIIVTPYVVRPVSATRMASPTDGLVAPTDVERILGGYNYRQQLTGRGEAPRLPGGQGLIGPAGFVLD